MTLIWTFYRKKKWNPSSTLSMKQTYAISILILAEKSQCQYTGTDRI